MKEGLSQRKVPKQMDIRKSVLHRPVPAAALSFHGYSNMETTTSNTETMAKKFNLIVIMVTALQ
jgi:hypothetical protein